jgi:type II secretory pathway component PulK
MDPERRGVQLLTVALLLFFLALIAIVAALLVLPQILG